MPVVITRELRQESQQKSRDTEIIWRHDIDGRRCTGEQFRHSAYLSASWRSMPIRRRRRSVPTSWWSTARIWSATIGVKCWLWALVISDVKPVAIKQWGKRERERMSPEFHLLLWHRFNDLYRELEYNRLREADVRLVLVNEETAAQYLPGLFYGKIRVFQDSWKDRLVERLGNDGQRLNNLVFDKSGVSRSKRIWATPVNLLSRCGNLAHIQRYPQSNIEDENNYQQLLRLIISMAKNKPPCSSRCA